MKEYCFGSGRPIGKSLSGTSFYCRSGEKFFELGSFNGDTYKALRNAESVIAFCKDKNLYVDKEGHSIMGVVFWEVYEKYHHCKFDSTAFKKAFLSLRDGDTISTLLIRLTPVFQLDDAAKAHQQQYPLESPKRPQMFVTIGDKFQFSSSKVREFCRSKVGHVSFQTDEKGKDCYKVFYDILKPEECDGDTDWREEYVVKHLGDFVRMAMIDADIYRVKHNLGKKVCDYTFKGVSYGVSLSDDALYFKLESRKTSIRM